MLEKIEKIIDEEIENQGGPVASIAPSNVRVKKGKKKQKSESVVSEEVESDRDQ